MISMYVCVELELLDVFYSSLLVLLFAANMATVTLSLKTLLKAQPPPPQILSGSKSHSALSELDTLAYCSPASQSSPYFNKLSNSRTTGEFVWYVTCEGLCEVWEGLLC